MKKDSAIQYNSVFVPFELAAYFAERKVQGIKKPEAFLELVKSGYKFTLENKDKWGVLGALLGDLTHHNVGTVITLSNVYRTKDVKPTADDLSWQEIREMMKSINEFFESKGLSDRIPYMLTFTVNLARLGYENFKHQ